MVCSTASRPIIAPIFRVILLAYCFCDVLAKLFESKTKKVARLTAELATLEAERLSKVVVVFGYEYDKLGFYTTTSIFTVLFVALILQLGRSRRKWKRLALSGSQGAPSSQSTAAATAAPVSRYTTMVIVGATLLFYFLSINSDEPFESSRKRRAKQRGKGSAAKESLLPNVVIVFGKYELDEAKFYALVVTAIVILLAFGVQIGYWARLWKERKRRKPVRDSPLDVIVVGCGPLSVGWFHLMQFLDMPNINVYAVVEPFYLDKARCPYPPQQFVDLAIMLDDMGIRCFYQCNQLRPFQRPTLCVVAGRTGDNPKYFRECVNLGASHIYLEAPGAPSIDELKDMQSLAESRGVEVYMGYQRLCSRYIEQAVELSQAIPKSHVFLSHNETHASSELHLVVSRYPSGMIRSMASQELAVLVTKFGVKVPEIVSFKVNSNRLFSEKQIFHNKTTGEELTDFARAAFKITLKNRRSVSVMADRCGGLVSFAVVKSHSGKELRRFQSHNEAQVKAVQDELRGDTEIRHQYIIEDKEYLELKKRVVMSISGSKKPSGLVSIQDGIDILALADYCTTELNAALKADR